jgi:hypothetical protein
MVPQSVRDFAPTIVARLDQLGVKVTNSPIFRLVKASLNGADLSFSFGVSSYSEYRFTSGLLGDEIKDSLALNNGDITKIMSEPSKTLPIRAALLPSITSLTNFPSRICAGGVGNSICMARPDPHNDFVFPVQTRSANVADGQGLLAVLPKGIHEFAVDPQAEIGYSTPFTVSWLRRVMGKRRQRVSEPDCNTIGTAIYPGWLTSANMKVPLRTRLLDSD